MPSIPTGYDVPDYSSEGMTTPMPNEPMKEKDRPKKTVYPDITLRGASAEAVMGMANVGETFTAEVTFKVTECNQRKGGSKEWTNEKEANTSSVCLEIMDMQAEGANSPPDEGADEQGSDEAIDSYRKSKTAPADDMLD